MKTKILVTGLWMGGLSQEPNGYCRACNYNYSWLFNTPSTLIWSDKIIITPFIEHTIENEEAPSDNEVISKTIKKVFELAREYDLIEVKDPNRTITARMIENIDKEIIFERNILAKLYPNQIRVGDDEKVPGQIFVEGQEFCLPFIRSIYASLILAREWDARCLFLADVFTYCKYKFGTSLITDQYLGQAPNAFNTIFNSFLPEYKIFPEYIFLNSNQNYCVTCANVKKCSTEYLNKLKDNLSKYLEIREYDEIIQIKKLISDIISRLELRQGNVDHDSIIREFRNEEIKITKRIRNTFPKINRWSNISMIASIPVAVAGYATGLPMVSVVGASIAGFSKIANEYVKFLKNKYKWIGFINKNISSRPKPNA